MNFEFDDSNHSNDSQQSNSSTDGKWVILEENLNRKEIEEFLGQKYLIPLLTRPTILSIVQFVPIYYKDTNSKNN